MAHVAEQFIYPYESVEWRHSQTPVPVNWLCIDDRPTRTPMAYRQTAGGAVGIGHDVAAAQILGGKVADEVPPVHIVGARAVSTLRTSGNILLGTHEGCKAELAALAVRDIVINDPDKAYADTLKVNPDMSESRFEELAGAYAQLKIEDPNATSKQLDAGYNPYGVPQGAAVGTIHGFAPVKRHPLMDMEHVAPDALVDNRRGVAFDNREALEAGAPAYHFSRRDQQELLDGGLWGFRIESQDYLDFSDVRHGVTLGVLTAPNGDPLAIHQVAAQ